MNDTPTGYIWLQDGLDGDDGNGPWSRRDAELAIAETKRNAHDLGGDQVWVVDTATGEVLAHLKDGLCPACEHPAILEDKKTPLPNRLRWVAFEQIVGEWHCLAAYSTLRKAREEAVRWDNPGLVWDLKRLRVAWRSEK